MVAARLRRYCSGVCHVRAGEDSLGFFRSEASTRPSRRGNRLITADGVRASVYYGNRRRGDHGGQGPACARALLLWATVSSAICL
jgi:hypothetical protein